MNDKINFSKIYPAIIVGLGALICSLLIKCAPEVKPEGIKRVIPIINTKLVKPQSIDIPINSQGTIIPSTESQLYPEIRGEVIEVSHQLNEGSLFKKGDILLKIDSRDYELDIKTAEAQLDRAKAALIIQQEEANFQRIQFEASEESEDSVSVLRLNLPQLKEAESNVEAAQANLEKFKRNLEKTTIRAPYDGLVRKKNVDIGTVIGPGYLIANIYATDYVEVKLPIPDEDLAFLGIPLDGSQINESNQPEVTLIGSLGGENIIWEGKIVRMEAEIDAKSRMATLIGRVSNPYNGKNPLRVGQFVEAKITGRNFDNIYKIDRELIRNSNEIVMVNMVDSTLAFKSISVLRYIDDIAIINEGLSNEILICSTNLDVMYNGMKVQLK